MRVAKRRRFPSLAALMSASYFSLEWTLVRAESVWLQGGPEGAIFLLGTGEHVLEPDGAVLVLVGPHLLLLRPGHDGLVQNSHEFKCGVIGTDPKSMFIICI